MPDIRFFTDEHVANSVAEGLRLHGIDVLTTVDANRSGAGDLENIEFARRERRVIFTHDSDYLRLADVGTEHVGIVYAPRQKSIGDIIRALLLIYQVLSSEDMVGHVEFI